MLKDGSNLYLSAGWIELSMTPSKLADLRASHEPGRADLPVGLDARQRVPAGSCPMRDFGIEEAPQGFPRFPRFNANPLS